MDKTVGHRRTDRHDPAALQRTLSALRRTGTLVPRGVYRFHTFEEADAWMTRTMARTHASHSSTTSSASPARGVDYADAIRDAVEIPFGGVPVHVASPRTLVRTKKTIRPSDAADCQFLQVLIDETR